MSRISAIISLGILFILPEPVNAATVHHGRVCSITKKQGLASCNAHIITDDKGNPVVFASPQAYSPTLLREAYNLTGKSANSPIVAIVDAYDDPTIKSDLDVYSKQYGLPVLPLCSVDIAKSGIPCLQKINQRGKTALPKANGGWATEIALDVEAVHAMCENCRILLVEATSPNMNNLLAAVDTAIAKGATIISNSWGGPEYASEVELDKHFYHPGVAITVSSGDSGYGVEYPAASPYVTAVGGTTLLMDGDKYQDENAWSGAGSGCSQFEIKPDWQNDTKCKGRTVADVSAVANPETGVAIYTSTSPKGQKGWFTVGGTSLAAPLIAATYAVAENFPKNRMLNSLPYLYGTRLNLHDVVGGTNGQCSPAYLCTGKTKYDGPTGLGTPRGAGAF
jgi:subtilase family serine protease